MNAAATTLQTLRADVVSIISGTIFLSMAATACAIATLLWHSGTRILVWLGLWSGLFGLQELLQARIAVAILPPHLQLAAPYIRVAVMYLLLVSALFAWRELSLGKLKSFLLIGGMTGLAIAAAGIINFLLGGRDNRWILYNHLLAAFGAALLLIVVLIPRLARLLIITNNRLFTASTLLFGLDVGYTNLSDIFHYRVLPLVASVTFAVLLFSLAYEALRVLFANERRLLAINAELDRARQIQSSILPTSVPELEHLRIAACYQPMTAIAGDFYYFIRPDDNHLGILIADVSGHGIPAALIASMIRVALHSVADDADNPARVLAGINRILTSEAPGQLISAAYLFIEAPGRTALYSAAGHPPLLWYRSTSRELQRMESNGLLLGVVPDCDYPVRTVSLEPADRLVLYTDGVTETENARGDSFGDEQFERVIRNHDAYPAPELLHHILSELHAWRAPDLPQQDDITLLVVDVL